MSYCFYERLNAYLSRSKSKHLTQEVEVKKLTNDCKDKVFKACVKVWTYQSVSAPSLAHFDLL
jgi:hypothetical protein